MFTKRNQLDIRKSTSKVQDPKKDLTTRIKHLKIILDNVDCSEAKGFFEANFSHVYNILYDSFILADFNLRQRVQKTHKEELECAIWILDQVLSLLPELIHKRWQMHSIGRILNKLLNPGNSVKLRRQGIRYFLMWYQALNENAPDYVDGMYASLVPGFFNPSAVTTQPSKNSLFHDIDVFEQEPVNPAESLPILPSATSEKLTEHPSKLFLEALLEQMVLSVVKLEWHDKAAHYHSCFNFLLEKLKIYYLPKICPNFSTECSLYKPVLDLPVMRRAEAENEFVYCRVTLIMWIINYIHQSKKNTDVTSLSLAVHCNSKEHQEDGEDSSHPSLDSSLSILSNRNTSDEELAAQIVREVLYSSRNNVNFLHELFRQAFLLNFNHVVAIRRTIQLYKDLIQFNLPELPVYMLELPDEMKVSEDSGLDASKSPRLRNDSYLGAIHKEDFLIRAGIQNVLQVFMTHAANVFLLEANHHIPKMLEEQTDACKRILNIYRHMVMNTRMDDATWEQLLLVLLQITSLVLGETSQKKKVPTLGVKLAPAIFQTLIVTWIKANLNVMISGELWDRFLHVLVSLTNWEDLIKEWAKTMDTLTRVLARHVYDLDLTDLPLDRLALQKNKKLTRKPTGRLNSSIMGQSFERNQSSNFKRDSTAIEENITHKKNMKCSRSSSETNLYDKQRFQNKTGFPRLQRSLSLDSSIPHEIEYEDISRSPSPAPSSGIECNSVKDSPLQLDMISEHSQQYQNENSSLGEHRGVICGGNVRGWLPDVAVILWRRMLGALGDINDLKEPKLHSQVFEYLVKLTENLIKIKRNQGISSDNQSTPPPPDLVPPLTIIIPWCFGAVSLSEVYEAGQLNAVRLLCTITMNCDLKNITYLPQFYNSLHSAFTGPSKLFLNASLKYSGPRFLSLQLPGSSLLILDLIHACNIVLNSTESLESFPRVEAVSIIANLLNQPNDSSFPVLHPELEINPMSCPDIKEHIVNILLRAGRKEARDKARCIALSSLGIYIYKELCDGTFHSKLSDAIDVILQSLKFNNKSTAQLACNVLFLLCDHATLLWHRYPRHVNGIISTLCYVLYTSREFPPDNDETLETTLLLCLGEWCMRLGPEKLRKSSLKVHDESKHTSLLLQVFMVLLKIVTGKKGDDHFCIFQPSVQKNFDPNILGDDSNQAHSSSSSPIKNEKHEKTISLCARTVLANLITHLGHFPMEIGATRLSSMVVEQDDIQFVCTDELSNTISSAPNIQILMLKSHVISSFIEIPTLEQPGGGITAGLSTAATQVRILLRDITGKGSWDASILFKKPHRDEQSSNSLVQGNRNQQAQSESLSTIIDDSSQNLPQGAMRHRSPDILPNITNNAPDLDQLDDLLQYLGHTSSECLDYPTRKLNEPSASPILLEYEQEAIVSVINQKNSENEEYDTAQYSGTMLGEPSRRPYIQIEDSPFITTTNMQASMSVIEQKAFQQCRHLFSQLGLIGWDKRNHLHLLNKSERLLRELRNLDAQCCRETHKIAVIYVGPGQEDKNSILSNQGGSAPYEEFLASLAWEIELENHTGFLGGLQRGGSTGLTAPYYATSFVEVIFHVSTRMPSDSPEAVLNKTRHLGNDEVHVVWSEHNRDYRRDIIPTEFCDILIIIYPLGNNSHRVTVNCKPDVPYFGILFDEAIIETKLLAGLIRSTAICASRAKRTTLSHYQQYYEERARFLETVAKEYKEYTIYEDFISKIFSPSFSPISCYHNDLPFSGGGDAVCEPISSSISAAVLSDVNSHLQRSNDRNDSRIQGNDDSASDYTQDIESFCLSPKPSNRMKATLKTVPKKAPPQESSQFQSESPL